MFFVSSSAVKDFVFPVKPKMLDDYEANSKIFSGALPKYLYSVVVIIFTFSSLSNVFAAKDNYPSAITSFTGGATYCQNSAVSYMSITFSTTTCGVGGATNIPLTVTWYSNAVNA